MSVLCKVSIKLLLFSAETFIKGCPSVIYFQKKTTPKDPSPFFRDHVAQFKGTTGLNIVSG
jgi:hypothetical protein